MDCAEIRDALARGEQPSGGRVDAHLRVCPGCAELCADGGSLGTELATLRRIGPESVDLGPGLSTLFGTIQSDLARERGLAAWLRAQSTGVRIALAIGGAALIAAAMLAFKGRPDLDVYPLSRLAAAVGAYALVIGAAARVALRPLQLPALSTPYRALVAVMTVLIPFAIAAAPAAHLAHPASLAGAGDDFGPRALNCFVFGSVLALPALVLLWGLDRGKHRAWFAAIASAGAAGLCGVLALELHCAITHPAHLVVGHATVAAALVLGYALITALRRPTSRKDVASTAR